jgi:hypothetical protein
VTLLFCVIDTLQLPVPLQLPDQPAKVYPVDGDALIVCVLLVEYQPLLMLAVPPEPTLTVR